MKHPFKEWIKGVFDRSAEVYGKEYNDYFNYFAGRLVDLANISSHAAVLDVATGRGAIIKHILKNNDPTVDITGIDISPQMIAETTKELNEMEDSDRVQLLCMDAEHLEFESNTFDYIFCAFGIFFFPHADRALKEFLRVLKPGGKLFLSTWQERDQCYHIIRKELEAYGIAGKVTLHNFEEPAFIYNCLSESGFTDITMVQDHLEHVYPTFNDWFQSLWGHGSRGRLEMLTSEQIQELKKNTEIGVKHLLRNDGLHEVQRVHFTRAIKPSKEIEDGH